MIDGREIIPGSDDAQRTQALLAAIAASSDDAIVSKNLDGIIATWNRGAERIFGYTAEEAIGQPILMIIPPGRESEERARGGGGQCRFAVLVIGEDDHLRLRPAAADRRARERRKPAPLPRYTTGA